VNHTDANEAKLSKEHRQLENHTTSCWCAHIAKSASALVTQAGLCGFVLLPVGTACTRKMVFENKKPTLTQVLTALYELYNHRPSIIHGDPHLPNLIIVEEGLSWIDLVEFDGLSIAPRDISIDIRRLVSSLYPLLQLSDDECLCRLNLTAKAVIRHHSKNSRIIYMN
jgi:hypothetical protein